MFLLRRSLAGVDRAMAAVLLQSSAATSIAQITGNSANGQTLFDDNSCASSAARDDLACAPAHFR